jgi:tetratricopeptide (TPR) repeat protein
MLFNKLFGDKKPPKSPDTSPSVNLERAVSPWEAQNKETIDELAKFIDFAEGFTVGFVEVSFPEDIDNLLKVLRLRPECRNVEFHVFDLSDPNLTYLQDELIQRINQLPQPISTLLTPKRIVLVKGLENSIGMFGDYPPVLQDLNFVRDALADSVQYPVLFCLPGYAINRVIKYAPDFWSWKSGVFEVKCSQESLDKASIQALHVNRLIGSLSKLERLDQISLIKSIIQEFSPLEGYRSKANTHICIDALLVLVNLYISSGNYLKAKETLEETKRIFDSSHWQFGVSTESELRIRYLIAHATVCLRLGKFQDADMFLSDALSLSQHDNDYYEALSHHLLGKVKSRQKDMTGADAHYRKSLDLSENQLHVNRREEDRRAFQALEASTLHQIACFLDDYKKDLMAARELFRKSLSIKQELGERQDTASTLRRLGFIALRLGDENKAFELFQDSLEIEQEYGHFRGIAESLTAISKIKQHQGKIVEAIELIEQSLDFYAKAEDLTGKNAAQHQLIRLKASLNSSFTR